MRRGTATVVLALAVGGAVAGCMGAGTGGNASPAEAEDGRERARATMVDMAETLTDLGLQPRHSFGRWTTCTDDGAAWKYIASARIDAPGPSQEVLPDALDALTTELGLETDGPGAFGNSGIARGTVDGLDVRLWSYEDDPALMVEAFGPCLFLSEEYVDTLDRRSQEIDIGGTPVTQE